MKLGQILKKRYGITHRLGKGRLCQTYLAEDLQLPGNPQCVVKVFRLQAKHPKIVRLARRIFEQESGILKQLGQESPFAEVLDAFEGDHTFFLVQEFIKGESFGEQLVPGQPWTESQVVGFLLSSLEGLAIAHQQNIIHRNLKPSNLIQRQSDQQWTVIDFGGMRQICALAVNSQGQIGMKGLLSHPGYFPGSERRKPTCSSDLYGLGVMALQALMGVALKDLPKPSPESSEILWREHLTISDPLAQVLAQMVAPDPQERYPSASDALQWLRGTVITVASNDDTLIEVPTASPLIAPPLTVAELLREDPKEPPLLAGRYRILESLGKGGFGTTFLAEDRQMPGHPRCVVKQLKPYRTTPAALKLARRLFDSEAQVLSQLGRHPQIPQLLAHFEENNEFYLVQEYIEGHDLEKELPLGHKLDELTVIALLRDILQVLKFVHDQKVIHRDIKPANIRRREDGKIVLIDFGAVKQIGEHLETFDKTLLTVSIGTPGYIPGEQAQGKPKLSSDVYSVGIIGIQALTGLNPEYLKEHKKTGELRWRDHATVSPYLAKIINKMVRYDFRHRYPSATEALAALDDLLAHPNKPVISLTYWLTWLEDNRVLGGIGMAIIALASAFLALSLFPGAPELNLSPANPVEEAGSGESGEGGAETMTLPQLPSRQMVALPFEEVVDAQYTMREGIVVVGNNPNQLYLYYPRSRRRVRINLPGAPLMVSISPNGQFAVVGHQDSLSWVNLQREQIEKTLPLPHPPFHLVLTDRNWVYGSLANHQPLFAVDLNSGEEILLSDSRHYGETVYVLDGSQNNLYGIVKGEDRNSAILRQVNIAQGGPVFGRDTPIRADVPVGQPVGFLQDGRLLTSNGVLLGVAPTGEVREVQKLEGAQSPMFNVRTRWIGSDRQKILLGLHGERMNPEEFNRLSWWSYNELTPRKTYELPPLGNQPEAPATWSNFVFMNHQGEQFYVILQGREYHVRDRLTAPEQYSLLIGRIEDIVAR
ncbi:serine/threonine protein kinase [Spirulina subsalsa FACHB-351]|uniref:non-specific serine/threonine protein kinase n=1 Tax=Spirulina subsalsa FACHB-351 TaxID=234711 RepID=A0ABT3L0Y5_9CYAN|nr:serine/threonine-protein kinase [Spirulina subsalsa]MCW6035146.1 serine/threonine protein kinase [Spirulina subsalsa FACHB-351]